jgi:MFS family permease
VIRGTSYERWLVLAAVFTANALPEFLWSNLPPVMTVIQEKYKVGATVASVPIIMFSVGTVLTASVAGRLIDGRGYRSSLGLGLLMMTLFAGLRALDGPFWILVLAQGGIGAAFSFIAGASSSYVLDWFDRTQASIATGICVTGLYFGLGSSMAVTPLLVAQLGLGGTNRVVAVGVAVLSAVAFLLIRERGKPQSAASHDRLTAAVMVKNTTLALVFAISFLTGGLFSAVATALEPIWVARGMTSEDAGVANGLFILGGIIGGFLMPLLETWAGSKMVLILCSLGALLFTYPLLIAPTPWIGDLIATLLGIFWLGSVPVCYTFLEKTAGSRYAGSALSAFWAINSIGSVVLVWVFNAIMEWTSWQVSSVIALLLLALNQIAAFSLPRQPVPMTRDQAAA